MDLGLESPSYLYSCFIRVHSWFQTTPAFLLRLSVSIRVHPWRTSLIPPWPGTCSRNSINRSRAGKPDLHLFVSIRVHSWFQTTPPFVVQNSAGIFPAIARSPDPAGKFCAECPRGWTFAVSEILDRSRRADSKSPDGPITLPAPAALAPRASSRASCVPFPPFFCRQCRA